MNSLPAFRSLPAGRRQAAALALEARAPATRRAYGAALARLDAFLDGRPLDDAALAAHIRGLAESGLAPASISLAAAAASFLARVAGWPNPRGSMAADALRIVRREHADRGRGQARAISANDAAAIIAVAVIIDEDHDEEDAKRKREGKEPLDKPQGIWPFG